MSAGLETMVLSEISAFVAARMGLHFPEERWPDLARSLAAASREMGFDSVGACARWLTARELTTREIETLASHLTVGETYFFRDPPVFALLERAILPALVAKRQQGSRTLRLWSAACCTGEEPYSLAVSCTRTVPDLRNWNVSILATDINTKFLARARAGVYSEWSFRGTDRGVRDSFFSPAPDKRFAIAQAIKKLVHFEYLNLAEDLYPSLHNHTNAMDVICCRNVLMYFTPDHQRRVADALHRSLTDGGYLIVSPAELSSSLFSAFSADVVDGITVYRKLPPRSEAKPSPVFVRSDLPPAPAPVPAPVPPVPTAVAAPRPEPSPAPPDHLAAARARANEGLLDEALAACREAIAAERTNPAAHLLYAEICRERGQLDDAIGALGKVLYLDQDHILAHYALGDLYLRIGKPREGKRHLGIARALLSVRRRDEIVPDSDGLTCGRLMETVLAMTGA